MRISQVGNIIAIIIGLFLAIWVCYIGLMLIMSGFGEPNFVTEGIADDFGISTGLVRGVLVCFGLTMILGILFKPLFATLSVPFVRLNNKNESSLIKSELVYVPPINHTKDEDSGDLKYEFNKSIDQKSTK